MNRPCDLELEQIALGCMILQPAGIDDEGAQLSTGDFYNQYHGAVHEAILAVHADGPVEVKSITDWLVVHKTDTDFSLEQWLGLYAVCVNRADTPTNLSYYASKLRGLTARRRIIDGAVEANRLARDMEKPLSEVIPAAEAAVMTAGDSVYQSRKVAPLASVIDDRLNWFRARRDRDSALVGLSWGLDDLDYMTHGLQPNHMLVLAGRPGTGKCLSGNTLIDDPVSGERITLKSFIDQKRNTIYSMGPDGAIRPTEVTDWICNGFKPVYSVKTRLGREIEATGNHPFLTVGGWKQLCDLCPGARIGVPRRLGAFGQCAVPSDLARLLAYFIAEGGLTGATPRFTNTDPVIVADFYAIINQWFPTCHVHKAGITYTPSQGVLWKSRSDSRNNPVKTFLAEYEQMGKLSTHKSFHSSMWTWTKSAIGEFIKALFSCDGSIYERNGYPRIEFSVASRQLALDVHHALTRFGIIAKCSQKTPRCWRVSVSDPASIQVYQQDIGWIGEKSSRCIHDYKVYRSNIGHVPQPVWTRVKNLCADRNMTVSDMARLANVDTIHGKLNGHTARDISQRRLKAYASVLEDSALAALAHEDIYWDEILEVSLTGCQEVYDLTVPDGANFIANDICVHNSSLALQIGAQVALQGIPAVFFSLEMSREQLTDRLLLNLAQIDGHAAKSGTISEESLDSMEAWGRRLQKSPLEIEDGGDYTMASVRSTCRRLARKKALGLIVIDYLQLMRGSVKSENRQNELSEISRQTKQLARDFNCPVLALAQLSRNCEQRPDKRPILSDLRESGSLEQDADMALFIYRDSMYKRPDDLDAESNPDTFGQTMEQAEIIVRKNRHGEVGTALCAFHAGTTRFDNMTRRYE